MNSPQRDLPLPDLPTDLDDPVALDSWYYTWNAWMAEEAARRNWPWLTPMTPAMLHEIVEGEKKRRSANAAQGAAQEQLCAARGELNALEAHLRATDSEYEAKRALLVPILQPIFKHIPPSNWKTLFEQAYARAAVPAGIATQDRQREFAEGKSTLMALENRLRTQDPAYTAKKAMLAPILTPALKQLPPSKWGAVFQQAYAGVHIPTASVSSATAEKGEPSIAESDLEFGSDVAERLYWLIETPARALTNLPEVNSKIGTLFDRAESAAQRDSLLHVFAVVMGSIDGMVAENNPALLEEFRNANRQLFKNFWISESLIGTNIDGRTLIAVCRREIARHRMAADCTPITPGAEPIPPISEADLGALNAEVDRQRREAAAGRIAQQGIQTILLYRAPGFPEQVAISKVSPPIDGGAFFLDFSRPIRAIRSFLGRRNGRFGTPIELHVPILHQGQNPDDTNRFAIMVHSRDPRFSQVRALWKERYPSVAKSPTSVVSGIKLVVDFYTQFSDG